MADNIALNLGSGGATLAADDVGGVEIPRGKLVHGIDGVNDGDVALTNPLPVTAVMRTDKIGGSSTTLLTPVFLAVDVASADNTLVAADATKKIRVLAGKLVTSGGANTLRFESAAGGTALTGQMTLADDAQFDLPYCPVGHFETAANELLNLELSGATSVDGWLVYVLV